MIYITGDLHGEIERLESKAVKKLKKGDTLIVCGDFGFVWDGSEREKKVLKKLGKQKYRILFVAGCHDNYDLLESTLRSNCAADRQGRYPGIYMSCCGAKSMKLTEKPCLHSAAEPVTMSIFARRA